MNDLADTLEGLPALDGGTALPAAAPLLPARPLTSAITPETCAACGSQTDPASTPNIAAAAPSYVYAIGSIEARFPNLGVEKEFAQATGRTDTAGKTDRQTLHAVLSKRENRYLVRLLCWVLTIQGLDTYLLLGRDSLDFELLIESIRPEPKANDLDVVIGLRGPLAHPSMCNGLLVPVVVFDQIYSFDRPSLLKSIPRPERTSAEKFGPAAEELFNRILQLTDNSGSTDEHRALNYLTMRYPAIYTRAAEAFAHDSSVTGVEVRPSSLSSARRMVDVIFSYTNRNTDFTEKSFVRVDVTEEFPFLVTKMSPFYERQT